MQQAAMGTSLNYLIKPSMESVYDDGTIENSPTRQFAYGAASMQGWRKKQEDKFTCTAKLCKNFSFFGVYDGHGGSEIAEYLQENLHLELKHFLESEEDVELALYLGFLSADSTLRVPEIIEELNSKLDLESSDTSIEKRKKLFHRAKLLEELKKTVVPEAQDADNTTQPIDKSLSQKLNVAGSSTESNADNVTQESTSGPTQDSSSGGLIQESFVGGSTQESSTGGSTQESSAGGSTQESSAGGSTQESSAGGSTQESSAGGSTQESSAGGSTQESSAGGHALDSSADRPIADSSAGGSIPDSSAAGPSPGSSAGGVNQVSSAGGPTQDPGSTGTTQDSCSAESTQDSGAAGSAAGLSVAHSIQDSNISKSSEEMDTAGPSQECDSSTEEEVEMEDESIEETIDMGEIGKNEIEQPLEYLLNQELESTDPEDEDFSYDEDTESEGSDEGVKTTPMGFKLTTEEFVNMQPGDLSGSTATIVLLNEKTIHVANVGDSRCVLSRNGEAIDMSIDHKPTDAEEKERITLNGGNVRLGRINDSIDMSRAFGDFKLKGSSLIPSEQCVTAEPTIKSIPIHIEDEFLVIASDGIWNAMTSQEVVSYINMRLGQEDCDLRDICNEIFQMILSPDLENDGTGCDNMSCIIIKFIQRGVRFPLKRVGSYTYGQRLHLGINEDQNITLLYNAQY